MWVLPDVPEPYHIRFSVLAGEQAAALAPAARERLGRRLIQLADLAAFAVGYLVSVSQIESMVADTEGITIKYQVDDRARTITAMEILVDNVV